MKTGGYVSSGLLFYPIIFWNISGQLGWRSNRIGGLVAVGNTISNKGSLGC